MPGLIAFEGLVPTVGTPEMTIRHRFLEIVTGLEPSLVTSRAHFDLVFPDAVQLVGVTVTDKGGDVDVVLVETLLDASKLDE